MELNTTNHESNLKSVQFKKKSWRKKKTWAEKKKKEENFYNLE